jgi:hypothetical protein
MGTWRTAIFSDDVAADVRDRFRELVGDGHAVEQATQILLEEFADELEDEDSGSVVWLALATVQWKLGRLQEEVKRKAIEIIDSGEDLKRWEDEPNLLKKRRDVLEKLKEQLNSPTLPPK